jgi:hypothetical protein
MLARDGELEISGYQGYDSNNPDWRTNSVITLWIKNYGQDHRPIMTRNQFVHDARRLDVLFWFDQTNQLVLFDSVPEEQRNFLRMTSYDHCMNGGMYDPEWPRESQETAKQAAIDWMMQRFEGSDELCQRMIASLNEIIPLDTDWHFTTDGKGLAYRLIRSIFTDDLSGSGGYPDLFRSTFAIISLGQCIVVHDERDGEDWKVIASWVREFDD